MRRSSAVASSALRAAACILAALTLATCASDPGAPIAEGDLAPQALGEASIPADWTLVWNDEFAGDSIDHRWMHEVNATGGGNHELQYYTARPENSFVRDGALHIVARREFYEGPDGSRAYTSARLVTKGSGDWTYGRFEVRARLPQGQGMWPAIWMMPTDEVYGGWAASGEIDIMELVGNTPDRVYGTLHYGAAWPLNAHTGDSFRLPFGESFADAFHVFTLIWEPDAISWYVDGTRYQTQHHWRTNGQDFPAPFDQRFYMILNLAVGGDWPGSPDSTTVFPQELTVDYVRVYQAQ